MDFLPRPMNAPNHHISSSISPGPQSSAGQPFNMQTALVALRCWWKVATPLGLALAVAAGVVVFLIAKPTYTAAAWLIIKANPETLLDSATREDPRRFISNQLELMKSPPIVDPVAGKPEVVSTPEIAREPDPVQALKRLVKIRAQGQSDFFVIEFTSIVPGKAALVANELANSYLSYQARDSSYRCSALIKLLEDQLTAQQAKVEDLRNRWQQLAKTTTGIDPFAVKASENAVQIQSPRVELQSQIIKLQLEHTTLLVQVQFLESSEAKESTSEPTPWEIDQVIRNQAEVLKSQAKLAELESKAAEHRDRSANPGNNRVLQQIEKEIAETKDKLAKLPEELRPKIKENLIKAAKAQCASELARLRQQLTANELMNKVLDEKLKEQIGVQKQFREKTFDEELLRTEYESAYKLYEAIKAKIETMRLEQRAPERVLRYQEARVPPLPNEALPYKKIGLAACVAFFLPFGLAMAMEVLYRRVSSRDQLETGGKIAVVGEVTALPRRVHGRTAKDGTPSRELQLFEESIDGLRTYLSLVHSLQGTRVLAVASAISGEGKTSLAAQLAVSIASATGESTLLIDGDTRSPDVHRIFDVDRGPGLVEVLRGESTVDGAIETGFSQKLHLLTAGQLDRSPHRLIGNGEFQQLVDKLRDLYRHIIIDTPPILSASEALVMARTADAAILCVRRDFSRVEQVQEAHARLEAAGVTTAGAVLNGIPAQSYAYRYGSYYYTRNRFTQSQPGSDPSEL
jgi:polysaccharide biosynthesis transport protein